MNVTVINGMMFNSLKVVLIFWLFVNSNMGSPFQIFEVTRIFHFKDLLCVIDKPDQFLPY